MNELLKKLNYKKGIVQILNAPPEFQSVIELWRKECIAEAWSSVSAISEGNATQDPVNFLICFAKSGLEAAELAAGTAHLIGLTTVFWVAYPKQTSRRYKADINRDSLWPILESFGYRPNRQVAIDEDWSALRFAKI